MDLEINIMDSHLAHLLEAKKALLDRWKGQRLNRRLRKKIAELNQTIEDHCQSLTRQQWDEVCNSVDGQMRVGGRVDVLRVLGMLIESNGSNSRTISKITAKTENIIRLINRVSNRRGGLREDNLLRLFLAFLMSHITYVAAMHCWHGHEKKKLDTLIRKSIKRVLGISMQASTERLMQLGVHNTLEEIIEAQETAQVARLSSSPAGRKILAVLGLNPTLVAERQHQLFDAQRTRIQTSPFLRNVHPQHNVGRPRARAAALLRHVRDEPPSACFVDAAQYGRSARFAAVAIDHKGSILDSASFKDSTPSRAEQAAIALALLDDSRSHIYTDSSFNFDASLPGIRQITHGGVREEIRKLLPPIFYFDCRDYFGTSSTDISTGDFCERSGIWRTEGDLRHNGTTTATSCLLVLNANSLRHPNADAFPTSGHKDNAKLHTEDSADKSAELSILPVRANEVQDGETRQ
ncbi:hypothetical protein HPB47_019118 [Ixodes persulcatus]|uniref:Uncharacterized protein n=1 Tax=Ixodes persulcatus TaxID=34615 RepID=A0AC60QMN7_IXOPE|nr:hypothetical protein HPB47_019118 [Ixodes persulcatus]